MPYTTPSTITTGQLVTASLMNTEWAGNIAFLANPPACRVYNSANISINHVTETALTFNSERFDTDNMHSTSSNTGRITFNTAGVYVVSFSGNFAAAADYLNAMFRIRLNGATFIAGQNTGHSDASVSPYKTLTTIYKFAAADYVEVTAFHENGGAAARNVEVVGNLTPEFSAVWVGLG